MTYDIIYADPPWRYGTTMHNGAGGVSTGSANEKYTTMSEREMCAMDVKSIASDDSLLFMWTTGPFVSSACRVGASWGFKFSTVAFVWDKVLVNPGNYTMSQCEFVLLFKRGRIPKPMGARNVRQMVTSRRGEHSVKPCEVAERIVEMFPDQSRIELFARRPSYGWDVWGNDVDSTHIEALSEHFISRPDVDGVAADVEVA